MHGVFVSGSNQASGESGLCDHLLVTPPNSRWSVQMSRLADRTRACAASYMLSAVQSCSGTTLHARDLPTGDGSGSCASHDL